MTSMKKIVQRALAALVLSSFVSTAFAEDYYGSSNNYGAGSEQGGYYGSSGGGGGYAGGSAPLQGRVVYAPAGTPVPVRLQGTLSSEFSRVGETFTAALNSPIYAGGEMVAPPGSTVQGQVVAVEPAGRAGKSGYMDLRLTSIITPDGKRFPLSASVDKASFQLSADSSRAGHFVKSTAVGAGAGALSGLVGAAISGGKKGKATAIGTGIGGGVGLLGGAVKKGAEFIIPSGSAIPFLLDSPLQVNLAPRGGGFGGGDFGGGGFQDPGQYR